MNELIFKMIMIKMFIFDHLIRVLKVTIFIIAMFIESENCSKSLMLIKVTLHDFNCSTDFDDFSILLNENDFSLS